MYRALYRKWRPSKFGEVYGQDQVTSILKYQVANNRHSHAYLFCGSRGTGKTSCAKILAKALNCLSPADGEPCGVCEACRSIDEGRALDVIEMDAASNNGINDIRDIRDDVAYTPSALKYRVYIVDEVHMLSDSAFNALLKTLEEPPEYIVFILATTELDEIPATIVSRCQRFDFRRIPAEILADRLKVIAETEGAGINDDGAVLLAKLANGGFRDAISLLELCISKKKPIDEALVEETIGLCGADTIARLVRAVSRREVSVIFDIMTETERSSKDITVFWQDIIAWYRDMLVMKTVEAPEKYLTVTKREAELLRETSSMFDLPRLLYHNRILDETLTLIGRGAAGKRNLCELALVRMCDPSLSDAADALQVRITDLEAQLARLSAGAVNVAVTEAAVAPDSRNALQPDEQPKAGNNTLSAESPKGGKDTLSEETPKAGAGSLSAVVEKMKTEPHNDGTASPAWWEEAIEKFASVSPSAGGFISGTTLTAKAGGTFIITVRSRTAGTVLARTETLNALCEIMTFLSGGRVTPESIVFNVARKNDGLFPGEDTKN